MISLIFLFVIIAILSYREIQILIDRGSWGKSVTYLKFWYIDWQSFWKNLDSFHVSHGLFVLVLMGFLVLENVVPVINWWQGWTMTAGNILLYWYGFFYVRNLFLHIIFMKEPDWFYIIPFYSKKS